MFKIPLYNDANYSQMVRLNNKEYLTSCRWNPYEEVFYFSILSTNSVLGCTFKLTQGYDLLLPYSSYKDLPQGSLFLVGETLSTLPTLNNIVDKFSLVFIEGGE